MDERTALLAFSATPGMGRKRILGLSKICSSMTNAWAADQPVFKQLEIGGKIFQTFDKFRNEFNLDLYLDRMKKLQIDFVTIYDPDYPELLKQTPDAPLLLYLKGNRTLICHPELVSGSHGIPDQARNDISTLAVVGTRKTSSYGREITQKIVRELAESGMTIVSGLALGIDAIAHQTTLQANGSTIAVLGCGVDCCYPRENQRIYDQMISQGSLIISEYPLSQPSNQGTFPARNRIVAGLSLGVLVTEAATDSGSLITADYAKQFGRPIFSIPGPITSAGAAGTTQLLKQGATLVTTGDEIIQALNIQTTNKQSHTFNNLNSHEQLIVEILSVEPLTIDDISSQSKLSIPQLMSILTSLELRQIIQNIGNQEYCLKRIKTG